MSNTYACPWFLVEGWVAWWRSWCVHLHSGLLRQLQYPILQYPAFTSQYQYIGWWLNITFIFERCHLACWMWLKQSEMQFCKLRIIPNREICQWPTTLFIIVGVQVTRKHCYFHKIQFPKWWWHQARCHNFLNHSQTQLGMLPHDGFTWLYWLKLLIKLWMASVQLNDIKK